MKRFNIFSVVITATVILGLMVAWCGATPSVMSTSELDSGRGAACCYICSTASLACPVVGGCQAGSYTGCVLIAHKDATQKPYQSGTPCGVNCGAKNCNCTSC